jgi:hypothetical protein
MKRFAGRTVLAMALTLAAALALSGSAFAQYGYYDNYEQGSPWRAHQYGFQNGFHDGFRKGHHEGRENDPGDINFGSARRNSRLPALDRPDRSFPAWL